MTNEERIIYVLEKFPETRNSDVTLVIKLWESFYSGFLHNGGWIHTSDLHNVPMQDGVARIRRIIQKRGEYLPTNERIARLRDKQYKKVTKSIHTTTNDIPV